MGFINDIVNKIQTVIKKDENKLNVKQKVVLQEEKPRKNKLSKTNTNAIENGNKKKEKNTKKSVNDSIVRKAKKKNSSIPPQLNLLIQEVHYCNDLFHIAQQLEEPFSTLSNYWANRKDNVQRKIISDFKEEIDKKRDPEKTDDDKFKYLLIIKKGKRNCCHINENTWNEMIFGEKSKIEKRITIEPNTWRNGFQAWNEMITEGEKNG